MIMNRGLLRTSPIEIRHDSDDMTELSPAIMEQMMLAKATELFRLCDKEEKGFITKHDMRRLQSELHMSPEQLDIVFESLDEDKNEYLTHDEFTEGFGSFLGMKQRVGGSSEEAEPPDMDVFEGEAGDQEDVNKLFDDLIMQIDARGVFQDESVVKAMWQKLHKEEPDLANSFEDFLAKTAGEIKRSRGEFDTLEAALKSKTNEHEDEVKRLYEEMEFQMKQEQQRILSEEKKKEKQIREEVENVLREKERQLQEMQARHQELEEKLAQLNMSEAAAKQDNQRLAQEKDMLEEMLSRSQDSLEESRSYINILQSQQRDEKKERARAALQLSEGIAMERESLVKQLDMLRDVNKRLQDDKDEADAVEARPDGLFQELQEAEAMAQQETNTGPSRRELVKQGSVLSTYFPGRSPSQTSEVLSENLEVDMAEIEEDFEMDDPLQAQIFSFHQNNVTTPAISNNQTRAESAQYVQNDNKDLNNRSAAMIGSTLFTADSDKNVATRKHTPTDSTLTKKHHKHHKGFGFHSCLTTLPQQDSYTSDAESEAVVKTASKRLQPVGAAHSTVQSESPRSQRIFKVVFVGDSGVGKSSFIHRFCNNTFRPTFSATIGVDFQVKSLVVGECEVVLQLWDTAGQERYRSVAKQYFRKADGVIIMYDVTKEQSFTSVRNWMSSVKEGVEGGTILTIVGNKTDLAEDDMERAVKFKDGSKLAVEYDALFYETSAMSGSHVMETMLGMASLLKDKEDKEIEAALKLTVVEEKKKGCCK